MVNKVLLKETYNFIKKNFKTYCAQVIIVMLGIGFFVGMKVSTIDLNKTMTNFIEDNNFYDYKINLEYGIEEKDIIELQKRIKDIKYIEGSYSKDIVTKLDGKDEVFRVHSYNPDKKLNGLKLKEGRLPKDSSECVIDVKLYQKGYDIADVIKINDSSLNFQMMTITGVVQSPNYLALDRGNSNLLSGKINYYVYVHEDNIKSNVYSDLFIKYDTEYKAFTKEYDSYIDNKRETTSIAVTEYFKEKYAQIVKQEQVKLNKAKQEYNKKKQEVDKELSSYQNKINEKQKQIREAEKLLASVTDQDVESKVDLYIANQQKEAQELATLKIKVDAAKKKYENLKKTYDSQNASGGCSNSLITTYETRLKNYNTQLASLQKELANTSPFDFYRRNLLNYQIATLKQTISYTEGQLALAKASCQSQTTPVTLEQVNAAYNEWQTLQKEYDRRMALYKASGTKEELMAYYRKERTRLEGQLATYKKQLAASQRELNAQKKVAYAELNKIQAKISDAQDKIDAFIYPKNYIFSRKDNTGYNQFIDDINKISNLASIVPIIFYLITFFMISASISRMMYEERNQIGTLKAIGVNNHEILMKYLLYSGSSVIFGSLLGILVGIVILPSIVYFIYEMLYEFPEYLLVFDTYYVLVATLIAAIVAILSTIFCSYKTFKETPVSLLKAKVGRYSKRFILERIPFIWNNIHLTTKITLKNIFRYKTRFIMTVVGIGGCLALMLTGLSLRSSITDMIPAQYGGLFKVDAQIFYKESITRNEIIESTKYIESLENVSKATTANFTTVKTFNNSKSININAVTLTENDYKEFIELRDVKSNEFVNLNKDGVLISEKLAKILKLKVGDKLELYDDKMNKYEVNVSGVIKTYIEHYVYFSPEYYQKIYNKVPRNNMLLVKTNGDYNEVKLAEEMNKDNKISQILYISMAEQAYKDIMNNLALLVSVFVVFSILLVFAVLYNLININIRERTKEIATYKVLGFSNKRVISIIKLENIILMFIGVILGLIFGKYLSIIVITTCEVENLNFIKDITFTNYLISALSTIIFTYIFSLLINKYVKHINLTESLKSNE